MANYTSIPFFHCCFSQLLFFLHSSASACLFHTDYILIIYHSSYLAEYLCCHLLSPYLLCLPHTESMAWWKLSSQCQWPNYSKLSPPVGCSSVSPWRASLQLIYNPSLSSATTDSLHLLLSHTEKLRGAHIPLTSMDTLKYIQKLAYASIT